MKEVENESSLEEEFVGFVGILKGYSARPIEKVKESSVRLRMEDWVVAFPKSKRFVELKLVLKTNSVVGETGFEERIIIKMVVREKRGSLVGDIVERQMKQRERE